MRGGLKAENQQDLENLQIVGIETLEDNKSTYGVFNFQFSNRK